MTFERSGYPKPADLMQTVIAADALAQDNEHDEGLYLERDTLLEDDYFETSLDDYDDLLSAADDSDWDQG